MLRKAKSGGRPTVILHSAWKDEKERWYAVTQKGTIYRSRNGDAWTNIREKDTPLQVSEAGEIAWSGATSILPESNGSK